ncbi:MAG: HAMP domain-containing protein, partial [Ideonella sp.]|nr:HAMP domain-containing protein [Ideonella sp.]
GLAWFNLWQSARIAAALEASTVAVRASMQADMLHDASRSELLAAQVAALTGNTRALTDAEAPIVEALDTLMADLRKAVETTPDPAAAKVVADAVPVAEAYRVKVLAAYAALKGGAGTDEAMAAFDTAFGALERALDGSGDAIQHAAGAISSGAQADIQAARDVTLALVALSLAVLALIAFKTITSVVRPLNRLLQATRDLNRGDADLSRRLPDDAAAEFGDVSRQFNLFIGTLARLVSAVQGSAARIASTSSQIASNNLDLSRRTDQAAGNLQQTASSVEQINATVQQTALSARQASELAGQATTVAGRGGEVVARVVATMEDIQAASRRIADITRTIDGIAFQTNILALNAAVEAARAGEQGRGFAVVAGEVRSLAQRAAAAAREIKTLIDGSVVKVESGSAQVRDAGQTMQEILASVQRVAQMIHEITAAAGEQSTGIALVNEAVTDLDRMTQENAALVERSAAAARDMREQAVTRAGAVAGFRTQVA